MNKIRIIDLLNKIANGEEMPNEIKYDNLVYKYNEQYDYKNKLQINYYSVDNGTDFFNNVFCYSLNDEVEIIEEDNNKIEKITGIDTRETRQCIIKFQEKFDEIIDKINNME